MATSGSNDFTLTSRQVVTFALRKLGVVEARESPSSEDMALGRENLNVMLKSLQNSIPNLWRMTEGSQALSAATASYALTTTKPFRIISARYRNAAGNDLPMCEMTRSEYYDLPRKSSTGTPTSFYFDPQRDSGTLYVWQVLAAVTTETIQYTYQRRFEDVDSDDNHLDVPTDHLGVIGYSLAEMLMPDFGIDATRASLITSMAGRLRNQASAMDREVEYRFVPGFR